MSNCYVFPEEELTALADAIRTKAGTSDSMTLNEMTQTVRNISSTSNTAIYGVTNVYDFGNRINTGDIAMGCRLFSKFTGQNITQLSNYAFNNSIINEFDFPLLEEIDNYAFGHCHNLINVVIPKSVVNMNSNCFESCSNLNVVTFKGTPSMIASSSFNNCRSLTNIYVPWSSGAVSGAPWGATKATIHYDTVTT